MRFALVKWTGTCLWIGLLVNGPFVFTLLGFMPERFAIGLTHGTQRTGGLLQISWAAHDWGFGLLGWNDDATPRDPAWELLGIGKDQINILGWRVWASQATLNREAERWIARTQEIT